MSLFPGSTFCIGSSSSQPSPSPSPTPSPPHKKPKFGEEEKLFMKSNSDAEDDLHIVMFVLYFLVHIGIPSSDEDFYYVIKNMTNEDLSLSVFKEKLEILRVKYESFIQERGGNFEGIDGPYEREILEISEQIWAGVLD